MVQYGPARTREKSATIRPASGPGRAAPRADTAGRQGLRRPVVTGAGVSGLGVLGWVMAGTCPLSAHRTVVRRGAVWVRTDPLSRSASRQGHGAAGSRAGRLRDRDLGRRLAGGPVGAD